MRNLQVHKLGGQLVKMEKPRGNRNSTQNVRTLYRAILTERSLLIGDAPITARRTAARLDTLGDGTEPMMMTSDQRLRGTRRLAAFASQIRESVKERD